MVNTMGGKVLKFRAEIWMEEGMEIEKKNTDREKKRADDAMKQLENERRQLEEERKKHEEDNRIMMKEIERLKAAAN